MHDLVQNQKVEEMTAPVNEISEVHSI